MPKIFLSYRRADSGEQTERIHDRLSREFGSSKVFLDVARGNIPAGSDFSEVLRENVEKCDVVLVIIGPKWLEIREELKPDLRRLENPHDFVRIEVETALMTKKLIIPLLVNGAAPIYGDQVELLPESLKPLSQLQFTPIRHNPDFHGDISNVIRDIKARTARPTTMIASAAAFTVILIMAILAGIAFLSSTNNNNAAALATHTPANPQTQAAMILTSNALPSATNTEDANATVGALLTEFAQTATAQQQAVIDTYTETPSPTVDANATQTQEAAVSNATDTQEAANIEASQNAATDTAEAMTQIAQSTANAPTNTPQATRTPTIVPSDTPAPTNTATPNLAATSLITTATQRAFLTEAAEAAARTQAANNAVRNETAPETATARSSTGGTATQRVVLTQAAETETARSIASGTATQRAVLSQNASNLSSIQVRSSVELDLKAEPIGSGESLGRIAAGTELSVYAKSAGNFSNWYLVEYPVGTGSYGWISGGLVQILGGESLDAIPNYEDIPNAENLFPIASSSEESNTPTLQVRSSLELDLRAEPIGSGENLGRIAAGTELSVYAKSAGNFSNWYLVEYPVGSGSYGWISGGLVQIVGDSTLDAIPNYEDIPNAENLFPIASSPEESNTPTLQVRSSLELDLKAEPIGSGENLGRIAAGTELSVYAKSAGNFSNWYLVEYPVGTGSYGWISGGLVQIVGDGTLDAIPNYEDIANAENLFPIGSR